MSTGSVKLLIDTTSCPIQSPQDKALQYEYYEVNKKAHTMKYETGFCATSGLLCWCSGGWPGRYSDITIARNSGIFNVLIPGELLVGDKFYIGVEHFITAFKGSQLSEHQREWNIEIKRFRQVQERFHGRLKRFNAFTSEWRNERSLHHIAFLALTHIVNLDVYLHPLN